jgi:branched-chain amino acid transport system ATP-binding protein
MRSFQQKAVFPGFTVFENVEAAAMAAGLRGRGRTGVVWETLRLLQLEGRAHERAESLPFGFARLLGIACLLPRRPRLMLLDEPAAGLADDETQELAGALKRLRERDYAICLVDHSMEFVRGLCDRVIVMDAGTVLAEGAPDVVMRERAVVEAYLGVDDDDE